jgi:hypothetical protein
VPGSELRSVASESAIDIDHARVDRGKELIDCASVPCCSGRTITSAYTVAAIKR